MTRKQLKAKRRSKKIIKKHKIIRNNKPHDKVAASHRASPESLTKKRKKK